ncbi:MAG: DUF4163 domain-containing protein [Oscillospiraceae bacterium]|nr:DUF4163 domain-containing protein [Oscillospiraceae bacterium]
MRKSVALLLIAVLLLCLFGCGSNREQAAGGVWVTYREDGGTIKSEDHTEIFVYSYQQPVLQGNAPGIHMINTKLDNATTAFLYGSGGVEEMTELAKMDWQESWFNCYRLERKTSVARLDDAVASFRYEDYAFNGGVHGNTFEYGMTYDMVSGEHMTLASLTEDEAGLKLVCRQHLLDVLGAEDFPGRENLMAGYEQQLDSVMKNWVLTDEGLQFIAQPYIISSYAMGTLRITVPYEKIAHVLLEKWHPSAKGHGGGTVSVTTVDSPQPAAVNFVTDADGESLVMKVNGTIYGFSVEEISAGKQRGAMGPTVEKQLLYSSVVASESFGLRAEVPEEGATMLLRWHDGSGTEYRYLLTRDTKHGAALTELEMPITE